MIVRALSLVYIIISQNKSDNDMVSFINYICHILPTLLFISLYFTYIQFLIEKYYEIIIKKKDIFFGPSLNFFNILVYIFTSIITLGCLITQSFKFYIYICLGIISVLFLILGWLYLYFGIKLSNVYSKDNGNQLESNNVDKGLIRRKILFISIFLGLIFISRAILSFLICVNIFNDVYPIFININLWDNLVYFFTELIISLLIGSTKQNEENDKRIEIVAHQNNIPNFNNEIVVGNIMDEFNNIHEPLMYQIERKV